MTGSTDSALVAFKAFERAGWEDTEISRHYEEGLSRVSVQAARPLLEAVGLQPGMRLLDVATGPGEVAAAAAAAGAVATGVDFSAAMVALARELHPDVTFAEGDAEALPFGDGAFDAVVMSYGMLHLVRPERGIAEAWRVLRPGGRFAFTVWSAPDPGNGFGILLEAIRSHGNPDVSVPPGPAVFRFSDRDECLRALGDAGFVEARTTEIEQNWRLPSTDALLDAMAEGTVRIRVIIAGQTQAQLEAVRGAMREAARPFETAGGIDIPMPAVLAVGRKP